jgi:2'-5' RNA ligase
MRAFIAIDIPDPARAALARVQQALPVGRLVDEDSLHLTLAFLGEQPLDRIEAAHEALETLRQAPFSLQLQGLGTFGGRVPATLWAGVADPAPVAALNARVRSVLHGAGLMLERRTFRPHVTLARFDRPGPEATDRLARFLGHWSGFLAPGFEVTEFGLWRSTLHRAGAVHDLLASYRLTGR